MVKKQHKGQPKIQRYTILILFGFLINFILFYGILLKDFKDLPSDGWSKELPLQNFQFPTSQFVSSQYRIFDVQPIAEGYLFAFADSYGITVQKRSPEFELIQEQKTIVSLTDQLRSVQWQQQSDGLHLFLYSLKQKTLSDYKLDPSTFGLSPSNDEHIQINHYTFSENGLFYITEGNLWMENAQSQEIILPNVTIDAMEALETPTHYELFIVDRKDAKRLIRLLRIDKADKQLEIIDLDHLPADNAVVFQHMTVLKTADRYHMISVLRNAKTAFSIAEYTAYGLDDLKPISKSSLTLSEYAPEPKLYERDGKVRIAYTSTFQLGRVDVARKFSKYPNVATASLENGQLSDLNALTRTEYTKIKPLYFESAQTKALFWMENNGEGFTIYGASDQPDHIRSSQIIAFEDYFGTFMNALTTYFPALYASMVFLFSVLVPIIVIYGALSFFKITWTEHHGTFILYVMVAIHLILKIYFFVPTITMTLTHMTNLSFIYSTLWGQLIYIAALSVLSLYAFYLHRRAHPHQGAFQSYLRFGFLDCLLLITAFYPLYFV